MGKQSVSRCVPSTQCLSPPPPLILFLFLPNFCRRRRWVNRNSRSCCARALLRKDMMKSAPSDNYHPQPDRVHVPFVTPFVGQDEANTESCRPDRPATSHARHHHNRHAYQRPTYLPTTATTTSRVHIPRCTRLDLFYRYLLLLQHHCFGHL